MHLCLLNKGLSEIEVLHSKSDFKYAVKFNNSNAEERQSEVVIWPKSELFSVTPLLLGVSNRFICTNIVTWICYYSGEGFDSHEKLES